MSTGCSPGSLVALEPGAAEKHQHYGSPLGALRMYVAELRSVELNVVLISISDKEPSRIPVVWKELLEFVTHHHVVVFVVTNWPIRSLLSSGKVKPVIYSTVYPLASAMDGFGALERRETWGKAVVRIRDEENKTTAKL